MFSLKDYSTLTPDELVAEEKKLSSKNIATAFAIGMVLGLIIYAIVQEKYLIAGIITAITTFLGYQNSQNLKNVRAEIKRREKNNH